MHIPLLAIDLIEALDKQYPERCPHSDDADRLIWKYAGQRGLIVLLLESLAAQEAEGKELARVAAGGTPATEEATGVLASG